MLYKREEIPVSLGKGFQVAVKRNFFSSSLPLIKSYCIWKFGWDYRLRICPFSRPLINEHYNSLFRDVRGQPSVSVPEAGRKNATQPPGGADLGPVSETWGGVSCGAGPGVTSGVRRSRGRTVPQSWQRKRRILWAISRHTAAAAQAPRTRRITASRRKQVVRVKIQRSLPAAMGTRQRSGCLDQTSCSGAWLARPFFTIRSTNR